jgi:hypothetical protein
MVDWDRFVGQLIGKVQALRIEHAVEAVRNPGPGSPEFAYGVAVGRDQGFELVLGAIQEMISQEGDEDG